MVAEMERPIMRLVSELDHPPVMRIPPQRKRLVRANRLDHAIKARQNPSLELIIRELSDDTAMGTSDQPLDPQERLNIIFPPYGLKSAWSRMGRVVRCEPIGDGYQVAIAFDATQFAA